MTSGKSKYFHLNHADRFGFPMYHASHFLSRFAAEGGFAAMSADQGRRFFGIIVTMNYSEHPPPHFHVRYSGQKAIIAIDSLTLLRGKLSPRVFGMVMEWAAEHQTELVSFTGVFAPLEDKAYFAQVKVNPDIGTICWPNEADLDPDVLYSLVIGEPIPDFTPIATSQ